MIIKRARTSGTAIVTRTALPSGLFASRVPTPSIWPDTRCPSIRSDKPQRPLEVHAVADPGGLEGGFGDRFRRHIRIKRKPVDFYGRQTGAVHGDAVSDPGPVKRKIGHHTVMRRPSPAGRMARMVPKPSTIPVNISIPYSFAIYPLIKMSSSKRRTAMSRTAID